MGRRRSRFIAAERRLVIWGIPRGHDPSAELLLDLLDNKLTEDVHIRDGRPGQGQVLTLVLAEHDDLLPTSLLAKVAERLSLNPRHKAVYDPWTVGGRAVDIGLAADMIGDVFRATTTPRRLVASRR